MAVVDVKAALRREMRRRRLALGRIVPDAADRLVDRYREADRPLPRIAAVYSRKGGEIDPDPLARWLVQQGVEVALPVVVDAERPLLFQRATAWMSGQRLIGFDQPEPSQPESVQPDMIFVPLLAFDLTGARLGQGGGFYDRTLAAYRQDGRVTALGLAYAGQLEPTVPVDAFDQPLDGVLTERGLSMFREGI